MRLAWVRISLVEGNIGSTGFIMSSMQGALQESVIHDFERAALNEKSSASSPGFAHAWKPDLQDKCPLPL